MQKKTIVANWKMNPLMLKEAEKLFQNGALATGKLKRTEVIICPPSIYLAKLKNLSRKIVMGAQDAFYGNTGAYTGEVSADMLYELGARYVILGHSERRALGETDDLVAKKVKSALYAGLRPILCIGEKERDHNHGYFQVIKAELEESLNGVSKNFINKIAIAYEPIWAISTTPGHRDASPEDMREMSVFIRKILADRFGKESISVKIFYGGSVNPRNAEEFLRDGGADGLLVGKASLDPAKFAKILSIAENLK